MSDHANIIAQVLMPHSYDFINPQKGTGQGSMARIDAAAALIKNGVAPADSFVLFPQGFNKKDPSLATKQGQESLGANLARYTARLPEMKEARIVEAALSWTTRNDMRTAYRMIAQMGYVKAHFRFLTDAVHLRRVKLFWFMYHPRGWTAEFFAAPGHTMSARERLVREPLHFLGYLFKELPGLVNARPKATSLMLRLCPSCHKHTLARENDKYPNGFVLSRDYCWSCDYIKIV